MMTDQVLAIADDNGDSNPLLLSVADAGRRLGLSKWMLYELMHAGQLPSIKIQSRRFIMKDDVDAYVRQIRSEAGDRHGL